MTLFIAWMLIYHLNMDWWWYPLSTVVWGLHLIPAVQRWTGARAVY